MVWTIKRQTESLYEIFVWFEVHLGCAYVPERIERRYVPTVDQRYRLIERVVVLFESSEQIQQIVFRLEGDPMKDVVIVGEHRVDFDSTGVRCRHFCLL